MALCLLLLRLGTSALQGRVQGQLIAVLAGELGGRLGRGFADVAGVDQQSLRASEEVEGGLGDRDVGDEFECVANASVDRVDPADQVGAYASAPEGSDQVWQLMRGRAQVDVAFQFFV